MANPDLTGSGERVERTRPRQRSRVSTRPAKDCSTASTVDGVVPIASVADRCEYRIVRYQIDASSRQWRTPALSAAS